VSINEFLEILEAVKKNIILYFKEKVNRSTWIELWYFKWSKSQICNI